MYEDVINFCSVISESRLPSALAPHHHRSVSAGGMSVYQNTNGMPMADGRNLHMGVAPGEGKDSSI